MVVAADAAGLACTGGGFHVDPWAPVPRAVLTHAHGDHARPGSGEYWCAAAAVPILQRRLGPDAVLKPVRYGERFILGDTAVSLHPAGHVLGSAQVRIEQGGEVWVVSGDYKRAADPTCDPFEVVPCDTFVTEATFGLPIYRWDDTALLVAAILGWWEGNRAAGRASVLFCYALGKAQRILAELAAHTDRTVLTHGAVEALTALYREQGVTMLPTRPVAEDAKRVSYAGELILAPPSAGGTPWIRRFKDRETALASGWMRVRGTRRRKGHDRGFALSDHADWPALIRTVQETGARRVLATHGYAEELARYLREQGLDASALRTEFAGEPDAE